MDLAEHLPNLVEFPAPLEPGTWVTSERLRVLEVRRLGSTCTVAGAPRSVFVAVHEKDLGGSMVTMFVVLDAEQMEWVVDEAFERDLEWLRAVAGMPDAATVVMKMLLLDVPIGRRGERAHALLRVVQQGGSRAEIAQALREARR